MGAFTGKAAFQGIAIGRIVEFKKADHVVRRERVDNTESEVLRFWKQKRKQ